MRVYWILLVSFIISQIHSHKYGLITYTLPLTSPQHPFKTVCKDSVNLQLKENLKLIMNCLNSSVFLFLRIQVLEIYLQILLTTAQPKRGPELCANVEL